MNYLDLLKDQFNHHVAFRERRPGVLQLIAPLYQAAASLPVRCTRNGKGATGGDLMPRVPACEAAIQELRGSRGL
jgi:hypothetical protein